MATYRSIASSETDAESPITQELMDAYRLNLIATAEGASGAPKIEASALGPVVLMLDDLTDGSANDSVVTSNPITTAYFEVPEAAETASGITTAAVRFRTATDGGSTPTSWTSVSGATSLAAGQSRIIGSKVTLPADTNYLEIDVSSASTGGTGYAKVTITGET